jgi:hypothetical protein
MKYNDSIQILKAAIKAIQDPMFIANKLGESEIFKFTKDLGLNNSIYVEDKSSNKEDNESVPREDSKSYNNNESNGYYNKQKDISSDPQGVIDSITQEITPVRLQQAIILSEIVGKPRSKTRKKRRF